MRHPYNEDVVEHDREKREAVFPATSAKRLRGDHAQKKSGTTKPSQCGDFVAQARCAAENKENRFR